MARKNKVKPEQLAPKIAEGYTDTPMTEEDARREFPSTVEKKRDLGFLRKPTYLPGTRLPIPEMVLIPNDVVIEEPNTGRRFHDVDQGMHPEARQAIQAGHMCLKCKEPHPDEAFPMYCNVCGYEMRERQILDCAVEFEGEIHVGPSKPLTDFMEDLDERQQKQMYAKKIREGGSRSRRRK